MLVGLLDVEKLCMRVAGQVCGFASLWCRLDLRAKVADWSCGLELRAQVAACSCGLELQLYSPFLISTTSFKKFGQN